MNILNSINEYNGRLTNLTKVIHDWNLTNSETKYELFDFSKKILDNLIENKGEEKIKRIIENDLCVIYGLYSTEFNSEKLTVEILNWWNS